jgi:C1A family cysteine protease
MRHAPRVVSLAALVSLSIGPTYAQELRNTGLTFLDENSYRSIPLASTPLLGNVLAEIDLGDKFPRPGNQGTQSSCVGWAVSYLKTYQEGVERKWTLSQANHQFSPAFIYNQIRTAQGCMGGSNFVDAMNILRRDGAATLADFPYDEHSCTSMPDAGTKQRARQYAIADWRRVNVQDEMEIKTQIAAGFPVLIGMVVDDAFGRLTGDQVFNGPVGPSRGGHAMVVVGYSDARQAFKVINSWGTNWGKNGFGWIGYATLVRTRRQCSSG